MTNGAWGTKNVSICSMCIFAIIVSSISYNQRSRRNLINTETALTHTNHSITENNQKKVYTREMHNKEATSVIANIGKIVPKQDRSINPLK